MVKPSRREALKLGLLAAGAVTLPVGAGIRGAAGSAAHVSPAVTPFSQPLRLPPVIRPVHSTADTDFYEVTQTVGVQEILPGLRTRIWGYNGLYPGPTFLVDSGRAVVVTQRNALTAAATGLPGGVPTTVHPHGLHVTAGSDGHPLDLVLPGGFLEHHYPNIQPAATLWYHDHAIDHTSRNVCQGLAGFYLIRDPHEQALPLPKGPFDVPLVIQDRLFNPDGSFHIPTENGLPLRQGLFGDVILVNGVPQPFLAVQRRRYRFRLLNGSDARFYDLRLSTGEPLTVIATDGGLTPRPVAVPSLMITPAERYEVVIDFARYPVGTRVVLQNTTAPDPFGDPVDPAKVREVMRFDVTDDAVDDSSVPADLAPALDVDPARSVRTRTWRFDRRHGAWTINGRLFDGNRIDAFPKNGTTEIWEFVNDSGGWLHPIHTHLVQYRVLDRNGAPPRPYELGPKDTVVLGPNETVRVAMRFHSFTGVYVMHCHNVSHEDNMMMTQFQVVP